MKLTREKIKRMVEDNTGSGGGKSGGDSLDFQAWANGSFLSLKNGGTVLGDTEFKGALTLNQENVATQNWVDDNYLSIDFFRGVFKVYAQNGEITPNNTNLLTAATNIKAMFGFWTESYISALGRGNGQATVVSALYDLVDVKPNAGGTGVYGAAVGRVLTYGSDGKWYAAEVGSGTIRSVDAEALNNSHMTAVASTVNNAVTIKVGVDTGYSIPSNTAQTNWSTAYTNSHTHANKSVLDGISSTDVSNWGTAYSTATTLATYFDSSGNAKSALKLTTVSKTAWGQTYWTSGGVPTNISGDMTDVGNITFNGTKRLDPNGNSLYIGNSNNAGYVYMADMCSQSGSGYWKIPASGSAEFTNVYSLGYVTALSDIRFKDVVEHTVIDVNAIARASIIRFTWKGRNDGRVRIGGIAQEWRGIMPEAVTEDSNGRLTMDYGVIGMVAAVSVSRKVQEQQREIDDLKRKMEILMNEVKQLKKM